ncbi:hypothetical protein FQ179_09775 [Pusillimonas sp. ANT_WB101]|nr:hypothetical protein FQ179_09775 [Pusillimonas sp. ANT_WB101]
MRIRPKHAGLSTAVDRHLRELVTSGRLKKFAQGLYHSPKQSVFGLLPPADDLVVVTFRPFQSVTRRVTNVVRHSISA